MPSLACRLWLDAQPDALAALHHPFIRALSNGVLPRLVKSVNVLCNKRVTHCSV